MHEELTDLVFRPPFAPISHTTAVATGFPKTESQHQATSSAPLVRRRAVSYRKNRPLLPSVPRQGEQKIKTAPARTPQSIPPSPLAQHFFTPGSTFSFCTEDFSSSPLAAEGLSAERYQSPAAPEEACHKFESEPPSGRAKDTSLTTAATAVKGLGLPRLELPSFPRLSLSVFQTDTNETALSEVARGKRPELREPRQSRRLPSEDMDFLNPESAMAMTEHRREAVRMAKSQEAAVVEKCKRSGAAAPGYTFDELIGKGSFGRVYKG